MHCSKQREYHIGKLKSADATVQQFCEHGNEVLHGTPLMLSASRSLGLFQFWRAFGLTIVHPGEHAHDQVRFSAPMFILPI